MRGKATCICIIRSKNGITPAHAGKSMGVQRNECRCKDHPRACGEKINNQIEPAYEKGSPPRMRGKAAEYGLRWKIQGITPAHAGKSASYPAVLDESKDHPRACGEKQEHRQEPPL